LNFRPEDGSLERAYASLAAMEGLNAPAPQRPFSVKAAALRAYPGLLACATAAVAATWVSQHYNSPVMMFALLFGLALNFLYHYSRCAPGIDLASKTLLRTGVALLGARITLEELLLRGWVPIVVVVLAVVSTIAVGALGARVLRLPQAFGLLSGGAVGICGASAALAIAAVLPQSKTNQRDAVLAVVLVTALSTVAMVIYPALAGLLHLSPHSTGLFLGGAIHDVAQVVGAGYSVSNGVGDEAIIIKLLRVALLLPVVLCITTVVRGKNGGALHAPPVPYFLFGFAALVCARSIGLVHAPLAGLLNDMSRWCLAAALVAMGMKTSLNSLLSVGWRPLALMVLETTWIAAVMLFGIQTLR